VLLSTDGYANSFASPDAFLKVGRDYLDMLRTEGAEEVAKNLPAWLEETSQNGSGDDITVGIIYRREPPLAEPASLLQTSFGPRRAARLSGYPPCTCALKRDNGIIKKVPSSSLSGKVA
jgi:hypothetical protein